jgi:hypothetical protein
MIRNVLIVFLSAVVLAVSGCGAGRNERVRQEARAQVAQLNGGPGAPAGSRMPFEFKGDRLGTMTFDEFEQKYGSCVSVESKTLPHGARNCALPEGTFTIAGAEINSAIYYFIDDRLYMVAIRFDHSTREIVKRALEEKYGRPMAVQYGRSHVWTGNDSHIVLSRAEAIYGHDRLNDEFTRRQRKETSGDL